MTANQATAPENRVAGVPAPKLDARTAMRLLNYELSRLLEARSVTHGEIAHRLDISRPSVSQALAGRALLSRAALEVVVAHLEAVDRLPRLLHLLKLARHAPRSPSPGDRDLVVGLEAYASRIEIYDAVGVCGLVLDEPRTSVLSGEVQVHWVLEEHVVRRVLSAGDRERVHRVLALPNVTVQVVPWLAESHPGRLGGFEIVHGPAGVVVCEEGLLATTYHDRADMVAEYRTFLARLRETAAHPDLSRALLTTRKIVHSGSNTVRRNHV